METISLKKHLRILRKADKELAKELRIADERALRIKDAADDQALGLAREAQTYRDERANNLREQINLERGAYATKEELKPVVDFMAKQQGRSSGLNSSYGMIFGILGLVATVTVTLVSLIGALATAIYFVLKGR